jgi:hypothetical protein
MTEHLLLRYLDVRQAPLGRVPEGEALHAELCAAAPRFYGHLAADPAAHVTHRWEALERLLDGDALDATLLGDRLRALPAAEALRTLEVLADRRINRHRARTLALAVVLNHPGLAELAATRRQRLVRLLKHVVGERTWSAVRRALRPGTNGTSERLLARTFWGRVTAERVPAVREALTVLAGVTLLPGEETLRKRLAARANLEGGAGLPRETLFGLRGTFHPTVPASRVRYLAPAAVRRADAPLTEYYKAAWAEGTEAAVGLAPPHANRAPLPGRLAVVLDLSASTASSGERAFHPAALGLALAQRLQAEVRDVTLHQVGGSALVSEGELPRPEGGTDLARGLLVAARTDADVILIVTDGYENGRTGDAADVAEGLLQLRPGRPIFQVVPRFTPAEDLSSRRLGEPIPLLPVDREDAAGELLARVVLANAGDVLTDAELEQIESLLFER